jgi:hypothetical protein
VGQIDQAHGCASAYMLTVLKACEVVSKGDSNSQETGFSGGELTVAGCPRATICLA